MSTAEVIVSIAVIFVVVMIGFIFADMYSHWKHMEYKDLINLRIKREKQKQAIERGNRREND